MKRFFFNENKIVQNEINVINEEHFYNFIDNNNKILIISDSHLISNKIKPKIKIS